MPSDGALIVDADTSRLLAIAPQQPVGFALRIFHRLFR